MAIQLEGASGTNKAEVTADNELRVQVSANEQKAGFAVGTAEVDAGVVTGVRDMKSIEVGQEYRLRVGLDSIVFSKNFPGAALHSGVWTAPVTTMTVTVASGRLNLNAGLSTASAAVARVTSYQCFPVFGTMGTGAALTIMRSQAPVTNNVSEWGAFIATGTTAPTDGAYFRLSASGSFNCIVNHNGTEIVGSDRVSVINTYWPVNTFANFQIIIGEDYVFFWLMPSGAYQTPVLLDQIPRPAGSGHTSSRSLPIAMRTYNTAITSAAQVISCAQASVWLYDAANGLDLDYAQSLNGQHIFQGQEGGTMGSLAQFANSANPAAAVPTNTTAALGVGLGGQFWETDTLAVTTDGIIQSYQNPVATAAQPGRTLMITGVTIDSFVQTVIAAGGYNAVWSLAFGHTAVSLATTESATSKAPRRIPLGVQTVAAAATALTQLQRIDATFPSGIPINPGEFVQVVKKKVGTVPGSGVIAHLIRFSGFMI